MKVSFYMYHDIHDVGPQMAHWCPETLSPGVVFELGPDGWIQMASGAHTHYPTARRHVEAAWNQHLANLVVAASDEVT